MGSPIISHERKNIIQEHLLHFWSTSLLQIGLFSWVQICKPAESYKRVWKLYISSSGENGEFNWSLYIGVVIISVTLGTYPPLSNAKATYLLLLFRHFLKLRFQSGQLLFKTAKLRSGGKRKKEVQNLKPKQISTSMRDLMRRISDQFWTRKIFEYFPATKINRSEVK